MELPEYAEVTISAVVSQLLQSGPQSKIAHRMMERMMTGEMTKGTLLHYASQIQMEAERLGRLAELLTVAARITDK